MEPENQEKYSLFELILALFDEKTNIKQTCFNFDIKTDQEVLSFVKTINILLILILCHTVSATADVTIVPVELCDTISGYILEGRYGDAENAADGFIAEYPDEPVGPLLKASVLQYECIDYEDYSRGDEFDALLDETEKHARTKINLDENDLWAKYYFYAADGMRGARASITGQFIYGVLKGRSGKIGMEKIIAEDPEFYDAYLLVGSYRFWKSVAVGRAAVLPFLSDESGSGLSGVKKAIERGVITGPLSNTVIIEMYLAYHPALAAELAEKMLAQYPSCRLFSWQLGEAYKNLGRFEDAEKVFTGIAMSMRDDENDDGSGEVRSWWKLAVLAKSVGKTEKCLYYCNKIIDYVGKNGEDIERNRAGKKSVFERQRERIQKARRMKEAYENE